MASDPPHPTPSPDPSAGYGLVPAMPDPDPLQPFWPPRRPMAVEYISESPQRPIRAEHPAAPHHGADVYERELADVRAEFNPTSAGGWGIMFDPRARLWTAVRGDTIVRAGSARELREKIMSGSRSATTTTRSAANA